MAGIVNRALHFLSARRDIAMLSPHLGPMGIRRLLPWAKVSWDHSIYMRTFYHARRGKIHQKENYRNMIIKSKTLATRIIARNIYTCVIEYLPPSSMSTCRRLLLTQLDQNISQRILRARWFLLHRQTAWNRSLRHCTEILNPVWVTRRDN
ncbi:hypothetical protein BRADI_2g35630v3 [Brachypodium distachyon]|uniref:Uncharacterized protein n=1 Tax=Brachypodium distachyon TaxID=15368 RepID=A0A0Q3INN4_BRADI|nr:hypothetical protein BRADI_2g35630v3 [Brachypodium distachyon]